jgi:hypothetical protein
MGIVLPLSLRKKTVRAQARAALLLNPVVLLLSL